MGRPRGAMGTVRDPGAYLEARLGIQSLSIVIMAGRTRMHVGGACMSILFSSHIPCCTICRMFVRNLAQSVFKCYEIIQKSCSTLSP